MSSKRVRKKRMKQQIGKLRCVLCGRRLAPAGENYISGMGGAAVCHTCIRTSRAIAEHTRRAEQAPAGDQSIPTPQALMAELDRTIAGQQEAKQMVSLALWKQRLRAEGGRDIPASHLLLYGPTGCGKTMLAKRAAELAGLPWCVFDATTLTEAGYRGRDAADILKDYLAASQGHRRQKFGIIILDEVDKLAAEGHDERQAYCRGTQRTLLKLLEGAQVPTGVQTVDTGNLLFVLCGAFTGLVQEEAVSRPIGFLKERAENTPRPVCPEDFVAFGMESELMGRVPNLAPIHPLTAEDLAHILVKSEGSAFREYQAFFRERGVSLSLPIRTAEEIARRTLALGTGARGLKAELDKIMEPLVLALAEGELTGSVEVAYGFPELSREAE